MSTNDPAPIKLQSACGHIRHKLMYSAKSHAVRGKVDDSSDTRVFFCSRTFEGLGPDDKPVSPTACAPGRSCFCAGP
jgi:hypothetical protein